MSGYPAISVYDQREARQRVKNGSNDTIQFHDYDFKEGDASANMWNRLSLVYLEKHKKVQYISGQCFHFISPENTKKLLVFWCFQRV